MIEKMNHYSMTNPASIYDEESLTALELAGRTAVKVNETIEAYNQLENNTNEHLQSQDGKIEKRLEEQDNRLDVQEQEIIPETVTNEVQKRINDGTFDSSINNYAGDIINRVNNLVNSVPEGATTMDTEIIDARMVNTGMAFSSLGDTIRTMETLTEKTFDKLSLKVMDDIELTDNVGWYDINGNFTSGAHKHTEISVNAGDIFYITTSYGFEMPNAILMVNGIKHTLFHTSNVSVQNTKLCVMPTSGNLIVNSYNTYDYKVKKVVNVSLSNDYLKTMNHIFNDLITPTLSNDEMVTNIVNGSLITSEGDVMPYSNENYKTAEVDVNEYDMIFVTSASNYDNADYVILDANNNILFVGEINEGATPSIHSRMVIMPKNATKIVVANIVNNPSVKKVTGNRSEGSFSGLKWVCMGDSLTEKNIRTTKNYHDYVAERTGITVVNMGVSGTGYARSQDTNEAFYQRILNIPTDVDVVTIFGSGNDLGAGLSIGTASDTGTETLCGCINTTINNLYGVLPTVQLGIVSPTPWVGNMPEDNGVMTRYSEALKEICLLRGIPFLDLYHCSGLRPNEENFRNLAYSKDGGGGVHPDETGHKMIASQFYSFLQSLIGIY